VVRKFCPTLHAVTSEIVESLTPPGSFTIIKRQVELLRPSSHKVLSVQYKSFTFLLLGHFEVVTFFIYRLCSSVCRKGEKRH